MLALRVLANVAILTLVLGLVAADIPRPQLVGDINAVRLVIDRVLGCDISHKFDIAFDSSACTDGAACWTLSDSSDGRISIRGSTASESTAAIGYYLRNFLNLTIGWPRGGGSYVTVPTVLPPVGRTIVQQRNVPWSYIMNVCTHSYSLVWYDWAQWEAFIDWMSLWGINMALAMTGQEEVQYKVFTQLGLSDSDIRHWFNGPAFLTWSRGQNEYGNNIAGPLPRSFMKNQWALQKQILARYRSLAITGQLPAFQGNVPIQLKYIQSDANITQQGGTGWMNSADPLFGKIADMWMEQLISDFGTDHWYQLDGYFNGGTAPWLQLKHPKLAYPRPAEGPSLPVPVNPANPPCVFGAAVPGKQLRDCAQNCRKFSSLSAAQSACVADARCGGVTYSQGNYELRAGIDPKSPDFPDQIAYPIANEYACHRLDPDPVWMQLGAAAFAGLTRTDPDAIWSFQGWAISDWDTAYQASQFEGFVKAVPQDKFVVIDMSEDGKGFWKKWDDSSFFGAPFIWTTLHDFGGNDGMKGNISQINEIPFTGSSKTSVIGTGYTPEGIDQNPAYYNFMNEVNFHASPLPNVVSHLVDIAHKRYGLVEKNDAVTDAWTLLLDSSYSQNLHVHDDTGVSHFPAGDLTHFMPDMRTPTPKFCKTQQAWGRFNDAAVQVDLSREPFRYDLVNIARECIAQLTAPASVNFSNAIDQPVLDADMIAHTGAVYQSMLSDLELLLETNSEFQVGPWLASARKLASPDAGDCFIFEQPSSCPDFYEWNARVQITTWQPTPSNATVVPDGPIDYANKQWSGLVRDYYLERVRLIQQQALSDASAGQPLNHTAVEQIRASLAYNWTTSTKPYPITPVGDAVQVSLQLFEKYAPYFASCQ